MAQPGAPQLLSDYSDFGRPQLLRDALRSPPGDSLLLASPDRRHLFLWLPRRRRLLSFPRMPAALHHPPPPGACLERSWPAPSPDLCELLFPRSPGQGWLLALVWRDGRAEVWCPPRSGGSGQAWELLQSLELCNSPRARVCSVCCSGDGELVWCEERPPSRPQDSSSPLSYCICRRALRVSGQRVTLATMKIVLHHSPRYSLLSSHRHGVYMVAAAGPHPILLYSPVEDAITTVTVPEGAIRSTSLAEGEVDYKKLVAEYLGFLARRARSEVRRLAVTETGQLLLVTTDLRIYLIHENGAVRHIFDIENDASDGAEIKMHLFGGTLACAVDTELYLVNVHTGRLVAKQLWNADELFLVTALDTEDVQVLTKTGVFQVSRSIGVEEAGRSEPVQLEMVYEEACQYYQRRSLSNAKLTVQAIKKEGMFQAPIILSAILCSYQKNSQSKDQQQYVELLSNMNSELQSFISLELLKACIINASDVDIEERCEELVDHEVTRLLQMDLDRDSLVYINSLFSTFPKAGWMSVRNNFHFQQSSDGKLIVRATADLWKKVLSPLPPGSRDSSPNGVYPLFEVICRSLCTYKPKWLPVFVQHAQDCSSFCWNFTTKDTCEGVPLYKRALSILHKFKVNTNTDLEVELLLGSGRPQAIIQAVHILIGLQHWSRVMEETRRFSQLSPLITKDIFITLLVEFVKNRHLDSYVNQLCEICPEGMTATDILHVVLQNLPKAQADPPPFSSEGVHLTIGLLKPLLSKVLQSQVGKEETFSSQTFPPVTPLRTNKSVARLPLVNGGILSPTDIYATDSSEIAPFSTVSK
ncbi:BLOC-2 complex member HPS6 [Pseudophryne corroboree]|uniref:BLOC-2 complex member HPS6 n=1 Tax=Pseudophryne corroboree TaxID=495146 RepID=UPI00308178B2